jgi:molecular chaperone HscB
MFTNHFEIFDLPVSFVIDTDSLAQRYLDLQRTVHPDKYANAPAQERRLAMQKATQINEAFQTLKNPLARGLYLLQLQGIDTNDNSTAMDNEFLLEQMDLREQLAEIKQQTQPINPLNDFLERVTQEQQNLTATLTQQFAQKNYQLAFDSVRKFQFFIRLHEEALRLEEELI